VASAEPLYLRYASWRDPVSSAHCKLFALGFPLESGSPLALAGIGAELPALEPGGSLLLDRLSQRGCGPLDPGGNVEVREQAARVVGGFELGVGFLADGALLASDDTFARLFHGHPLELVHLGLVRLAPGADRGRTADLLRAALPPDTTVRTRAELDALQRRHWVEETAVGNIFALGGIAGFLVGFVVLTQVLSTDIRKQLPLYATLKAMGYARHRLRRLVLEQAWLYGALGFGPALLVSALVFGLIRHWTRLPVFLTGAEALAVLALAFVLCSAAAWLSSRKLDLADPAELY
jgi:putative ABC transport system permease protein